MLKAIRAASDLADAVAYASVRFRFHTAWLALRVKAHNQSVPPSERWAAYGDMHAAARELALYRLNLLFPEVYALHFSIASLAADTTLSWRFLRIGSPEAAAEFIRSATTQLAGMAKELMLSERAQ